MLGAFLPNPTSRSLLVPLWKKTNARSVMRPSHGKKKTSGPLRLLHTCVCVAGVALGELCRRDTALLWRAARSGGERAVVFNTFTSRSLLPGNRRSERTASLIPRARVFLAGTFRKLLWPRSRVLLFFRWGRFEGLDTSWFRVLRACGLLFVAPLDESLGEAYFPLRTQRGRGLGAGYGFNHFPGCSHWNWAVRRLQFRLLIFLSVYFAICESAEYLRELF